MTQLRFLPTTFAASAVLLLAVLAPRPASALLAAPSACTVNSDCEQGFECTVVGSSGCASAGAAPACPPGESCEAPAPEPPEPCATVEQRACTPAQCATDAECAAGMVCHAYQVPCAVTNCYCPPDAADCNCGVQMCNPETVSMCTPRYALPCTEAADCGEGFTCEQQASDCGCGGGTEPAPGGAGFAPLPPEGAGGSGSDDKAPPSDPIPEPECPPCEPSGVFACVAQEILCDDASDCPAGWICEQEVQASEPSCDGPDCPEPKPAPLLPARRLCQPEYYGGGVGVDDGGSGTPTTGTPGGVKNPEAAPNPNSPSAEEGDANESAACQMGRGPASSGALSLLAVLGALLGLRRRRA